MAFEDDLQRHAERIKVNLPLVRGEEGTKHALVVPLLQLLGYDVFDPREVQPEYVADFAKKKGGQLEKVDYVISLNGVPAIFIECKAADVDLRSHDGQLARYFNATPSVRVAVLTNGVRLKVFTDLQSENIMDDNPWLDVDIRQLKQAEVDALKWFRKSDFAADQIVSQAETMVYYNRLLVFVSGQLREPSEEFVRLAAKEIPTIGTVTKRVVERLAPILKKAIQASVSDIVSSSFGPKTEEPAPIAVPVIIPAATAVAETDHRDGIVTTAEEMQCYGIIEKIIKGRHPNSPVAFRDAKTYFTIMQKGLKSWFVRLGVERKPFWIAFRHVKIEEAKRLCPNAAVVDAQFGDSRVLLQAHTDVSKLGALILAAYDAESAKAGAEDRAHDHDDDIVTH